MHRFLLPFIILGILLASPVGAFFNVEELEKSLEENSSNQTETLDAVIQQLQQLQETPPAFADVPASAWYGTAVAAVAQRGIVSGYKNAAGQPTGKFGPTNPVTVAEILKMAHEAANIAIQNCTSAPKHPQAAGHWAKQYVACAEQRGVRVLQSNPNLNRPASRAEVVAILHDVYGLAVPPNASNPFSDTAGHPYQHDISYAAARGVVSGDTQNGQPTGTFRPNDGVNRAEAAAILHRQIQG